MTKLVLFDIDGTLIRTGGAGVKAFARAFATEFGIVDGTERLKFAGRTDVSLVREFFIHNRIEAIPGNFDRFFKTYISWLEKIIGECEGGICEGVSGFMHELRALSQPPLIGLLTGNFRRGAEIKLHRFNLWNEFAFGAFADDHEERDCIAAIAKRRGAQLLGKELQNDEVLIIGDTHLDIRCARAIKAKVLAVGTGGATMEELKNHKPDWLVKNLSEVRAVEVCA